MLSVAVYAFIVATAVVVVRGIFQESQWWAAFAVIILTPLALLLTLSEAWRELTSALPRPLWLPLAALSAGYLTYVVFRVGLPTVLLCVGAFMLSTVLFLFPVIGVLSAWYNRGRPYDHL